MFRCKTKTDWCNKNLRKQLSVHELLTNKLQKAEIRKLKRKKKNHSNVKESLLGCISC